jgi:2,5-diketo-D-gluconate reductase B
MTLPRLGYGTYRLTDEERCLHGVRTALETGYRHVDTAQFYENETAVGRGIAESDVAREDVFLATKVWNDRLGHDDVLSSTRRSLERLAVDAVDLLYVHWPRDRYDPEETLPAFDELHDQGLIEHVGLSNFTPELLDEAREHLDAPVFAHQVEMHPLLPQEDLLAYAQRHDHWLVAYAPIARNRVADVPEIRAVAEKHDATPAQVSLAWLRSKDNVAAIPKAADPDHIGENYAALDLDLDEEDLATIDGIDRRERLIDPAEAAWNR